MPDQTRVTRRRSKTPKWKRTPKSNLKALQRLHQQNETGYRFNPHRDVEIDTLITMFEGGNLTEHELAEEGKMALSTVKGVLTGKTVNPRNTTVTKFGDALGWKRVWVKKDNTY